MKKNNVIVFGVTVCSFFAAAPSSMALKRYESLLHSGA